MAQWEEQLNAILGDSQTMSRIMAIAQSLEGGGEAQGEPSPSPAAETPPPAEEASGPDPRLMAAGMQALSAWNGPDDSRTALLRALGPFLREERRGKLDKAVRITKLSRVIRTALDGWKGGGEAGV